MHNNDKHTDIFLYLFKTMYNKIKDIYETAKANKDLFIKLINKIIEYKPTITNKCLTNNQIYYNFIYDLESLYNVCNNQDTNIIIYEGSSHSQFKFESLRDNRSELYYDRQNSNRPNNEITPFVFKQHTLDKIANNLCYKNIEDFKKNNNDIIREKNKSYYINYDNIWQCHLLYKNNDWLNYLGYKVDTFIKYLGNNISNTALYHQINKTPNNITPTIKNYYYLCLKDINNTKNSSVTGGLITFTIIKNWYIVLFIIVIIILFYYIFKEHNTYKKYKLKNSMNHVPRIPKQNIQT